MKALTQLQKIERMKEILQKDIDRWNYIYKNGCNDPFWPDGVNLNLKRNHIIYDLKQLDALENKPLQLTIFMLINGGPGPVENDKRIPPLVPDNYMVRDKFVDHRRMRI